MSEDVVKYPAVCSRPAARVMFRLKTIHGNRDVQLLDFAPARGDFAESAGYHLRMDVTLRQFRQQLRKFTVSHQRIAADNREMDWLKFVHDSQRPKNQIISFIFSQRK